MKTQTLLLILCGMVLSYLVLNIQLNYDPKIPTPPVSENPIIASIDTLPKYLVERDGIITPKGMKYHILIVTPDTAQNWKTQQMLIKKTQKFHMLLPEIE